MTALPPAVRKTCDLKVMTNPFQLGTCEVHQFIPIDEKKRRSFSGHQAIIDRWYPLTTIEQLVNRYLPDAKFTVQVLMDGVPVPREQWQYIVPRPGSRLYFYQVPQDDFGGVLRAVAMIVIAIGAAWIAGGGLAFVGKAFLGEAFFAGNLGAIAAAVAFSTAGALVVNAVIPPTTPETPDLGSAGSMSPSYGWDGARSSAAVGVPIARIGGEYQVGGNVISLYRSSDGEKQYLHMLVSFGQGPFATFGKIQVNGTDLEQFRDKEYRIRPGIPNQSAIETFHEIVHDRPYSDLVTYAASIDTSIDGVQKTTKRSDVTRLSIDLTWPGGLYRTEDNNNDADYGAIKNLSASVTVHCIRVNPSDTSKYLDATFTPFEPFSDGNTDFAWLTDNGWSSTGPILPTTFATPTLPYGQVLRGFDVPSTATRTGKITFQITVNPKSLVAYKNDVPIKLSFRVYVAPVDDLTNYREMERRILSFYHSDPVGAIGVSITDIDQLTRYRVGVFMDKVENVGTWSSVDSWSTPILVSASPDDLDNNWELQQCYAHASSGTYTISGGALLAKSFWRTFTSPPLAAGKYIVRVKKNSVDYDDTAHVDKFYITSVREHVDQELTHPGLGLVGVRILATDQLSGGTPTVTCIPQPVYYDWRTDTVSTSTNPAVVCYSVLTDDIPIFPDAIDALPPNDPSDATWFRSSQASSNGFPADEYAIDPDRLITAAWTEWADWCDELIDRGDGVSVKRCTFRGVFDTPSNRWEAALLVAKQGRASIVQIGTKFTIVIEREATPVQTFGHSNIIKGTFRRKWIRKSDRAKWFDVQYTDTDRWAQETISVVGDTEGEPATIRAFGCADSWEAMRLGYYHYYFARYARYICSWLSPVEKVACTVGDVAEFFHEVTQIGDSGLISAVAGGGLTLTLDQTITLSAGNTYYCKVRRRSDDAVLDCTVTTALPATTSQITVVANKTIDVNQQVRGGQWVYLGSFPFAAGASGYVRLTNAADGYVIADAAKFVLATDSDIEIIIDDKDTASGAFTGGGGGWVQQIPPVAAAFAQTWPQDDAARTNRYHAAGDGTAWARWTPTITTPGMYHVFCWYSAGENRATNTPYTVYFNGTGMAKNDDFAIYHLENLPGAVTVLNVERSEEGIVAISGIEYNSLVPQLVDNPDLRRIQTTIPRPRPISSSIRAVPQVGRLITNEATQDVTDAVLSVKSLVAEEVTWLTGILNKYVFFVNLSWSQPRNDYPAEVYEKDVSGGWKYLGQGYGAFAVEMRNDWMRGKEYEWTVIQTGPGNKKAGWPPTSPTITHTLEGKGLTPSDVSNSRAVSNGQNATVTWDPNPSAERILHYQVEVRLDRVAAYGGTSAPYRRVEAKTNSITFDTPWAGTYYIDIWAVDDYGVTSETKATTYVIVSEAFASNVIVTQNIDNADGVTWTYYGSVCLADDDSIRRPSIAGSPAGGPYTDQEECDFQNFGIGLSTILGTAIQNVPGTWFSDMDLTKSVNYAVSAIIDLGAQTEGYFDPFYESEIIDYATASNWSGVDGEYLSTLDGQKLISRAGEIAVIWEGGNQADLSDAQTIEAGQVNVRYVRCTVRFNLPSYVMEGRVWDIGFTIDVPDKYDRGNFTTDGTDGQKIDFNKTFIDVEPAISLTPEGSGIVRLSSGSISSTGFAVDSTGAFKIHYLAQGY